MAVSAPDQDDHRAAGIPTLVGGIASMGGVRRQASGDLLPDQGWFCQRLVRVAAARSGDGSICCRPVASREFSRAPCRDRTHRPACRCRRSRSRRFLTHLDSEPRLRTRWRRKTRSADRGVRGSFLGALGAMPESFPSRYYRDRRSRPHHAGRSRYSCCFRAIAVVRAAIMATCRRNASRVVEAGCVMGGFYPVADDPCGAFLVIVGVIRHSGPRYSICYG